MNDSILQKLERRLQVLEDERAILDRLAAYGQALDYDLADEWDDLWTDDAVLHWPGSRLTGAAIRDAFRAHPHAPTTYWKHFLVEPRVRLDGDVASVVSYFALLMQPNADPRIGVYGRYRDTLVRCDDGQWRFRERVAENEASIFPDLPGAK